LSFFTQSPSKEGPIYTPSLLGLLGRRLPLLFRTPFPQFES